MIYWAIKNGTKKEMQKKKTSKESFMLKLFLSSLRLFVFLAKNVVVVARKAKENIWKEIFVTHLVIFCVRNKSAISLVTLFAEMGNLDFFLDFDLYLD